LACDPVAQGHVRRIKITRTLGRLKLHDAGKIADSPARATWATIPRQSDTPNRIASAKR
jgi:hypothetical protein